MESLEYAYIIGSNANCTNTFETGLKYLVKQICSHLESSSSIPRYRQKWNAHNSASKDMYKKDYSSNI